MPKTPQPWKPTKKHQAAMDAAYEARKQVLAARQVRDATTPTWLQALRQYIDAAIEHHIAMQEVGGDGYYTSDSAGEEQCEEAWTQVVQAVQVQETSAGETITGRDVFTI